MSGLPSSVLLTQSNQSAVGVIAQSNYDATTGRGINNTDARSFTQSQKSAQQFNSGPNTSVLTAVSAYPAKSTASVPAGSYLTCELFSVDSSGNPDVSLAMAQGPDISTLPDWLNAPDIPSVTWDFSGAPVNLTPNTSYAVVFSITGASTTASVYIRFEGKTFPQQATYGGYQLYNAGAWSTFTPNPTTASSLWILVNGGFTDLLTLNSYLTSVTGVPRAHTQSFYNVQSAVIDYLEFQLAAAGVVVPPDNPQLQLVLYENFQPADNALPVTQIKAVSNTVPFSMLPASLGPVQFTFPHAVVLNGDSCYTMVLQVITRGLSNSAAAPYISVGYGIDANPVDDQLNSAGLYGSIYTVNMRNSNKIMLSFAVYGFLGGSLLELVQANTENLSLQQSLNSAASSLACTFDASVNTINTVEVAFIFNSTGIVTTGPPDPQGLKCQLYEAIPDPVTAGKWNVGALLGTSVSFTKLGDGSSNQPVYIQFRFRHAMAVQQGQRVFLNLITDVVPNSLAGVNYRYQYIQSNTAFSSTIISGSRWSSLLPVFTSWTQTGIAQDRPFGFRLYQYQNSQYSVTYDANLPLSGVSSGAVPTDSAQYNFFDPVAVANNTGGLSNTLNNLLGWAFASNAAQPDFYIVNPSTVSPASFPITGLTTLFAVWEPKPVFTMTYNANFPSGATTSGTVPVDPETYFVNDLIIILDNSSGNLTAANYFLAGWAFNPNAALPDFRLTPSGVVPSYYQISDLVSTNYVLYAVWKPVSSALTVTYVANSPAPVSYVESMNFLGDTQERPMTSIWRQATSITPTTDIVGVSRVTMKLRLVNSSPPASSTLTCAIYAAASSTTPEITPLVTSNTVINFDAISDLTSEVMFEFDGSLTLSAGTLYFISVERHPFTASIGAFNVPYINGGPSTGSRIVYSNTSVSGWSSAYTNVALFYRLYVSDGGASGVVPVDPNVYTTGQQVTLLGNAGVPPLEVDGYKLGGWAFRPDAAAPDFVFDPSGNPFPATFTIIDSSPLYGFWYPILRVIYDGNGATGGTVPVDLTDYVQGQQVNVMLNTGGLTKLSAVLLGWATDPSAMQPDFVFDPAGQNVTPSSFIIGQAITTLYAVWRQLFLPPVSEHGVWLIEAQNQGVYEPQTLWRLDSIKKELPSCGGKQEASLTTPNSPEMRQFLQANILGRWRISYNGLVLFQGIMTERYYSNTEINIRLVEVVLANIISTGGLLSFKAVQSNALFVAQQILASVSGVSVGLVPSVVISVDFTNVTVWEAVRKFAEALGVDYYTDSDAMQINFQPRSPRLFAEPVWLTSNKRSMNDLNRVDVVQVFGVDQNGAEIMGQYPEIGSGVIRAFSSPTARNVASLLLIAQYQFEQLNNPSTNGNTMSVLTHFMFLADAGDYVLVNQPRLNFVSGPEGFLIHRVTIRPVDMTLDVDSPTPTDIKLLAELSAQKISNASTTILPTQVR